LGDKLRNLKQLKNKDMEHLVNLLINEFEKKLKNGDEKEIRLELKMSLFSLESFSENT